ncbi:MAG: ribosome silencing factor [Planctomycetaceae bacterium]
MSTSEQPSEDQQVQSPDSATASPASATPESASAVPRSHELYERSLKNAMTVARIADELRGQDIVVMDLTTVTSIVDFFVVVTGTSRRQMNAIADEVNRKIKQDDGNSRLGIEGYRTEGHWILVDFGDIVLHVFTTEGRAAYDLEQLWADAARVDWQESAADNN